MAEGNESQGGELGRGGPPGGLGPELPGRRSEGDLLAERRARRAAESGEVILMRRAEAAEATVQTLESHVASLQQRLLDAEDDLRRTAELLEVERTAALEREHELRRVKQREYAEQQLRVETEERLTHASEAGARLDRESRAESERLARRLSASEQEAREVAERLESLQRQLAEAEHAAAAERAAVRRAEEALQTRLGELESRANRMQQGLQDERAARERTEAMLEDVRKGHRQMEGLVGEMKGIVERLSAAIASAARKPPAVMPPQPVPGGPSMPPAEGLAPPGRGTEMADALAAAVERLRARAEATPAPQPPPVRPQLQPPTHKHSMSLIGRWRIRRKQRRGR
jgi:hypothetical protein